MLQWQASPKRRSAAVLALAMLLGLPAHAALAAGDPGGGHEDPFSLVLLELALVIVLAVLGRWIAGRLKQPSVLGELFAGMLVGNVGCWLGIPLFRLVMHLSEASPVLSEVWRTGESVREVVLRLFAEHPLGDQIRDLMTGPQAPTWLLLAFSLWMFSNLGVILLLLLVGLESSVDEMKRVGVRASLVALVGIVAPFGLGLAFSLFLLPNVGTPTHLFLAATLCATSVGITARVFKDLNKIQTSEAKIILGAAVIDDVLGLIILAIVSGIAARGYVDVQEVGKIVGLSAIFLGVVLLFGTRISRMAARLAEELDRYHAKLLFPLALAFGLAWLASSIQLAAIVGAFAAGLILEESHFTATPGGKTMEEWIAPLEAIFAPVFFVLMGMQVDLSTFTHGSTLAVAMALLVAAIIGKLVCGLPAGKGMDRLSIGIGMVPRGEVGLIFASIGKSLGVVTEGTFSAIVIVVIVSTLITPLALRWSLFRQGHAEKNG